MKIGILLLAGGLSSRMDYVDKATLTIHNDPFMNMIANAFQSYPNKYLSINSKQNFHLDSFTTIIDEYHEIGPISGIVSCFHQSDVDALFVVSCDMPLVKEEAYTTLYPYLEKYDGVFYQDQEHSYPTLGFYTRKLLPNLEEAIRNHHYGLYRCIIKQNVHFVSIEETSLDTSILTNINTVQDYQEVLCKLESN